MADGVVGYLIERLSSLIEEEASLLTGVRDEAEYMRDELRLMTAFLGVADQRTHSDPQLKEWVNQVREVAYDTEDLLDKFTICHDNGFHGCLRVKNLIARHQIASEIQKLRSRVTRIGEGHLRYYDPSLPHQSRRTYNWRNVELLPVEPTVSIGLDGPKQQLVDWLLDDRLEETGVKCISVVGMGGCGKTTLAYQVYIDARVRQHFQSRLWLVMSESFKLKELMVRMIENMYADMEQPAPSCLMAMDEPRLKSTIANLLDQRRYLVVIDDVWSVADWEVMLRALPENNHGSRLLLTTRDNDIALRSSVNTNGYMYHIKPSSPDAAWELFCRRAFRDASCPPHLEEICRIISKKCAGLPLAIVTIAGVLSTKDQDKFDEWQMFLRGLSSELAVNENLETVKILLSLSYDDLPYHLKICYLYMYVFPEDGEIERMRLIRLWIAEGFVQDSEEMIAEEVAERYLYDLVNRCLIQVSETDLRGRPRVLRIHDVLRDVVLSRAKEQRIVTISGKRSNNLQPVRRLAFHNPEEISQGNRRCFNQLRSLIVLEYPTSLTPSKLLPILSRCKLLKVLDLRGVQLEVVPNEIFDLVHLKYLSMRRTGLRSLSNKIGRLQCLETLDLKDTHVTELPGEILRLRQLRHLLVYSYDKSYYSPFQLVKGCKTPIKMGKLASLQKLCYVDASSNRMITEELGSLIQLRRLGVVKLRREDTNALCASVAKLTNLRSLSIHSIHEEEILDIESLSLAPLQYLQSLELRGPLNRAPVWIHSLQSLVNLKLRWSNLTGEPLNFLQDLPNLKSLDLKHAFEGNDLQFKRGGFQRLKRLTLVSLQQLRRIRVEEQSMPELEELYICDCELMYTMPIGIQHLTKLQRLYIVDMPLAEQFEDKEKEHANYCKIAHIPLVLYRTHQNIIKYRLL